MENILELREVSRRFSKSAFTLDKISFSLPYGAILGFVGENGAGKTTTIGCILNTIKKDSGMVKLFGREMEDGDTDIREKIGVVYDGDNFPGFWTTKQLSQVMEGYDILVREEFSCLINSHGQGHEQLDSGKTEYRRSQMKELPERIHDDTNGLDYVLVGDYYIPALRLTEESRPIGHWGRRRKAYLEEARPALYCSLLLSGKLWTHLADVNEQAQEQLDLIMEQMKAAEGVTEKLKADDQLEWVRRCNSIRSRAEEIVRAELIYV